MRLPIKYFLYLGVLHSLFFVLSLLLLRDKPLWFLASELAILASLYLAWRMYRAFIVPVQLMASGAESLKQKDFSVQFNRVGQRELDALIEVYNQMIEQLRLERTHLTEQHYLLQKLISASPAGIMLLDLDGHIYSLNGAAERILGQSVAAVQGRSLQELLPPFGWELSELGTDRARVIQASGNRFYRCIKSRFIDRGFERQFIMVEELTEEILRTEKGAYDKVIRMMSHEVNNSIGAVNSILQSVAAHNGMSDDFKDAIGVAVNRNLRLSKFMGNFADVVKIPQPRREPTELQDLLQYMHRFMESQALKGGVSLQLHLPDEPLVVQLDREQLEQVLVNVIKNALEAAGRGGRVDIRLEPAGLRILNTGPGIPPEVQKKLFTPFYSTKPQGQGIGLMLVREILRNHQFPFSLQTLPDGLTEFWIGFNTPLGVNA
ncbi:sensor histidine kinase [Cesiribacter andamanensis]|uniref:histidine kinase n=1 Tax=Cesiribacter andamanensis AMV16 TaxID=1279009 RepID=M7N0J8_9BACT|nr:ATP-binding protein [Cesiribacter andamanensis]EMR00817.1 Sporulation kinase A [Cesiribacter andamanensis AMV16]